MEKEQVRKPSGSWVDLRSSRLAAGPPMPVGVDLDSWLEPADPPDRAWWVPVPAPFKVDDLRVLGAAVLTPGSGFDPRAVPWLASDFAHLASASPTQVRDFADRYGVTGPWTEDGPGGLPDLPRKREVDTMTAEANEIRRVFRACFYLQNFREDGYYRLETQDKAAMVSTGVLTDFLGQVRMPEVTPGFALEKLGGGEIRLSISPGPPYWPPPDLLHIIRLQVLADWVAGRQVRECAFRSAQGEPCGKLFVWPEKSAKSRLKGWGHPPAYCSPRHAAAAAQQRRRAKEKE